MFQEQIFNQKNDSLECCAATWLLFKNYFLSSYFLGSDYYLRASSGQHKYGTYSLRQLLTFDHDLASPCSERLTPPFLNQLTLQKVIYLKRKPYYSLFDRSFEIGRIFAMKGSRPVLVELVLFQVRSTKTRLEPSMTKILPV